MRENLSPWAEDDIAQLRYQLERSRAKKAYKAMMDAFRNRQGDHAPCAGCGTRSAAARLSRSRRMGPSRRPSPGGSRANTSWEAP